MIPSYNKGEWSEAYVLVKVIADGVLAQGDGQFKPADEPPYKVISAIRNDGEFLKKTYTRRSSDVIVSGEKLSELIIDLDKFDEISKVLFQEIKEGKGRTFPVSPELWSLLNDLSINQIKEKSDKKADIQVEVRDHFSGVESLLGFSVKSQIGGASTLVNSSQATNFRFRVNCSDSQFNELKLLAKGKKQVRYLKDNNISIEFEEIRNTTFRNNLALLDAELPKILAECLVDYYSASATNLVDVINLLDSRNPCNYPVDQGASFYSYKLKRYLCESALGMMPTSKWTGQHDATGGYIIVCESGEVLSYHLLRKNLFEDYLIQNTKFETASTTRQKFGEVLVDEEGYYIDLNLQIRFLK